MTDRTEYVDLPVGTLEAMQDIMREFKIRPEAAVLTIAAVMQAAHGWSDETRAEWLRAIAEHRVDPALLAKFRADIQASRASAGVHVH